MGKAHTMNDANHLVWLILLWMVILSARPTVSQGSRCFHNYASSTTCAYRCHCDSNNCDTNSGQCQSTQKCATGWFGPACQYADLLQTQAADSTDMFLRDNDDTTCNTDASSQSVTMTLKTAFPFTWLRVVIKNEDLTLLRGFNVQLHGPGNSGPVTCNSMRTRDASSKVLDVYCDGDVAVQSVTITGDGVKLLCSVYFSGGRNIALMEKTEQSSTRNNNDFANGASLAVDGDTTSTCTHTKDDRTDSDPLWRVDFVRPRMVSRYVLYNRLLPNNPDCCRNRLKGFDLTSYSSDGSLVFHHRDQIAEPQAVYTVISDFLGITNAVSYVIIKANKTRTADITPILTLCEVEVYGACPRTLYGRNCEMICSENCFDQTCNTADGTCVACAAGRKGNLCDEECDDTYYGPNCRERCGTTCVEQLCNSVNGTCKNCPDGKMGDQCTQECGPKTYGQGCTLPCSVNCINQLCDPVSGKCYSCTAGKMGDFCESTCGPGTFGPNCSLSCDPACQKNCDPNDGVCTGDCPAGYRGLRCNEICGRSTYGSGCSKDCSQFCNTVNGTGDNESPCHHVTGTCIYGCIQGYEGLLCEAKIQEQNPPSSSPGLGVGLGIGLGVAALIVIIGVAIYCYRRRSKAQRARRQIPPGYDPADPTTDEHKYSDLFKSADDYNLPTDMASSSESPTSPPENIPQDTVQYVNAEVGHYEDIGHVTFNGESEGNHQPQQKTQNEGGKDNPGYANVI